VSADGQSRDWVVAAAQAGERLDRFLAAREVLGTRSQVQRLIEAGRVTVDGQLAKGGVLVRAGQRVAVEIPPPTTGIVQAEAIDIAVLYEDEWLLAIDKPAGLVVHPAPGHWSGTLVNALLHRWSGSPAGLDPARCGIVHRLDKDTSGVMLVAKDVATHAALAEAFRAREVGKEYVAFVHGVPRRPEGEIDEPIGRHPVHRKRMSVRRGGRAAVTRYRVLERFSGAAFVEARPKTGRTHQIRVHLAALGHPILADPVYARGRARRVASLARQALHARAIAFPHPQRAEIVRIEAPLPADLSAALAELRAAAPRKRD
jgi:23S rRNA pseudouridine1911/1915/1917 synthase